MHIRYVPRERPPFQPYTFPLRSMKRGLRTGADPGFSWGGGGGAGRKRLCARTHIIRARSPKSPYGLGPKALGGFDALSCYLGPIFKHSETKMGLKNTQSIKFEGGGGGECACRAPSNSATVRILCAHPYSYIYPHNIARTLADDLARPKVTYCFFTRSFVSYSFELVCNFLFRHNSTLQIIY